VQLPEHADAVLHRDTTTGVISAWIIDDQLPAQGGYFCGIWAAEASIVARETDCSTSCALNTTTGGYRDSEHSTAAAMLHKQHSNSIDYMSTLNLTNCKTAMQPRMCNTGSTSASAYTVAALVHLHTL
jgi:hypothetical protein